MQVEDPVQARKALLESTKIVIRTLQARQELLKIKEERHTTRLQYEKKLDEVRLLIKRVGNKLPKHDIKMAPQKQQVARDSQSNTTTTPPPAPQKRVDILEKEISRIEERIKMLG